jgi:hypothetical protein
VFSPTVGQRSVVAVIVPEQGPFLGCDLDLRVVPPAGSAGQVQALTERPCRNWPGQTGYVLALVRADAAAQEWTIEVDNGGRGVASGLTLAVKAPLDGGTLHVPGQATGPVVPTAGAVSWALPLAAGNRLTVATQFAALGTCIDVVLLRPDGTTAAQQHGCGAALTEVTTPLAVESAVDDSGTWQMVILNESRSQSFIVDAALDAGSG